MSKLGTEATATLQILLAGALWGLVGPLIKLMEWSGSDAASTSFIRMTMAFAIMGVITLAKFGPSSFKLSRRELIAVVVLGVFCNGVYNLVYSLAIQYAGITVSAVLLNSAPVFTAIASVIIFREGLGARKVLALFVNILGCCLAATHGQLDLASISVLGILCGIASAFTYGMAAVVTRLSGPGTNAYVISTYSYLFAAITVAAVFQPWGNEALYNPQVLSFGFLLALIPTSIAYLIYYKGVLKMRETSKVPVFASVEMIATALVSVAFFGEVLNAATLLGIVLVIVSIGMMSLKKI